MSGVLQMLMIEDATTGVTNWTEIQSAFQNYTSHFLVHLAEAINDTIPEIANILNRTTGQVTKTAFKNSYFPKFPNGKIDCGCLSQLLIEDRRRPSLVSSYRDSMF